MSAARRAPAVLVAVLGACVARPSEPARPRPLHELALDSARWIQSSAQPAADGTRWPADPLHAEVLDRSLYSGSAGVVLFLLALAEASGDERDLAAARRGADALVADLASIDEPGLYTGLAGASFTLLEAARVTREPRYRAAAASSVRRLGTLAHAAGSGVEWNETTDVIAGGAGIGLFLLQAARELDDPLALALARRAGEHLIELGTSEAGGLSWAMDPSFPRRMPNFAHGTAGIAFFLARLYEETHEPRFLSAAQAGAKYLLAVADTAGDICRVFHDEPDGKDLYYLGWCHGPVGTARLFYELYRVTGDETWWSWTRRAANAIEKSGVPEQTTSGFWNNDGRCCGLAGVAAFFLELHRAKGEPADLDFCRRVTRVIVERATRDAHGARWVQAEHRVKPELLVAQTGWMQGAAGIGAWLLELDAFEHEPEHERELRIRLPDDPF